MNKQLGEDGSRVRQHAAPGPEEEPHPKARSSTGAMPPPEDVPPPHGPFTGVIEEDYAHAVPENLEGPDEAEQKLSPSHRRSLREEAKQSNTSSPISPRAHTVNLAAMAK